MPTYSPLISVNFLATFVVSTSNSVARAIVTKLSTMCLSHFSGEDVDLMSATVRGAAARLNSCGRLPGDMSDIVTDILDTASCFKFRAAFDTLRTMGNPIMKDWEKMLDRACELYHDLALKGRWAPIKKKESSFVGRGKSNQTSEQQAKTPVALKTTNNLPPGKKIETHDRKGNPIDRKPPKQGEPSTRTTNGKTEHWCGECDWKHGQWGNHQTAHHDDFVEKQRAFRQRRKDMKRKKGDQSNERHEEEPERRTRFHIPEVNANLAASLAISRVGTMGPF